MFERHAEAQQLCTNKKNRNVQVKAKIKCSSEALSEIRASDPIRGQHPQGPSRSDNLSPGSKKRAKPRTS